MDIIDLDDFTTAYLEAALWSSTDEDGRPLDDEYDISDFAPEAIRSAAEDCTDFQEANEDDLDEIAEQFGASDAQNGHDFWLTRNRHGAGFWDRGYGAAGRRLTDAAHVYGSVDLYVGDDGQVYSS